MWQYNPATEQWIQIDDFPGTARRYFSGTTLGSIAYAGLGTNGTNFNDFWIFDHTLHLLETNLTQIQINTFPNPTSDILHFDVDLNGIVLPSKIKVILSSSDGKVWINTSLANELALNVNQLPQGSYYCYFEYNGTSLLTKQITIQR